jgi:pimeloyl-ACP methyl ester carboxylesterase
MASGRLKGMAWGAAGAGTALGAALMLVRETDAARIEADPEWKRLNRPLDGRELEVRSSDGTRLHVESFGRPDAPAIVLVHGWMCALRLWRYQLDSLADDFHAVPAAMLHCGVRFVALSPRATPGQVAFCERMFVDCQPDVRGGCGGTLSSLALGEAIASLDVPTVVVSGKRDRLTPTSHSRRFAATLPRLMELVEVPGAGHMTPVEAPAEVTAALRTAATI